MLFTIIWEKKNITKQHHCCLLFQLFEADSHIHKCNTKGKVDADLLCWSDSCTAGPGWHEAEDGASESHL